MEKENRRAKITKLLLTDSFLHLLEQKPLPRITVKDICDYADLNRSTYYRYFTDPYDQMTKLEEEIIEEMVSCLDSLAPKEKQADSTARLPLAVKQILDYIHSKKDMFRILLSNHGDYNLQKDILTVLAEKLFSGSIHSPANKSLLKEYIFISTGSFGMIYYWLMTDTQADTGELTEQITQYCLKILQE